MDKTVQELIIAGRNFLKNNRKKLEGYQTDQELKKPQPELVKAPMTDNIIDLPKEFDSLNLTMNLTEILIKRKSNRVYTQENLSLLQLSYLLWATQGIKAMRGKKYATIRTVPSGGARHNYETYFFVRYVEGLKPGFYHYLPMGHKIELLSEECDLDKINASLQGQLWSVKSSVIFYYAVDVTRSEWRNGINAHRPLLIDLGHIGENLYLACTALGLGTCGIGAYDQSLCDKMLGLNGETEFVVYTETVGTISEKDLAAEKAFYAFVEEQDL